MNKHAFILAALIGAASAQAQEVEQPFHVTVAAGAARSNLDCTGATSCDNSGVGGKLIFGHKLGYGFGLELGYINFGKVSASDSSGSLTLKPAAIVLGTTYSLPLSDWGVQNWGVKARLGLAQVKTKATVTTASVSGSVSENKSRLHLGLGATYAINKNLNVELGVDSTRAGIVGEKFDVRLVSLGATYAF
jgi:opacity protein-like surface antigen